MHKGKYVSVYKKDALRSWPGCQSAVRWLTNSFFFFRRQLCCPLSQIFYLSLSYHLALVLTFPKYLCRTPRRLETHSGLCSALRSSRPQSLVSDRSHREPRWLFISFYCIFTHWPELCEKQKRISLNDGAWNVCLHTPGYFAIATFCLIGFLWVYNESGNVFVLGCVRFKDWRLIWRRHCAI